MQLAPKSCSLAKLQCKKPTGIFSYVDGTTSVNNSDKIYELKAHSRFKEVGRDVKGGIAGTAAIAVPRRKDF